MNTDQVFYASLRTDGRTALLVGPYYQESDAGAAVKHGRLEQILAQADSLPAAFELGTMSADVIPGRTAPIGTLNDSLPLELRPEYVNARTAAGQLDDIESALHNPDTSVLRRSGLADRLIAALRYVMVEHEPNECDDSLCSCGDEYPCYFMRNVALNLRADR